MQLNISSISLNICWTIQNGFFSYFIHILKIRYQHVYNDYFAYFYCEGMIWKTLGHLHQAHNKWKSSNEFCIVIDLTLNFLTKNMRCSWVASRDTNRKRDLHRLVTRTTMTTTGQQQIRNWKEACHSRLGKFKFQHFPISSFVSLFFRDWIGQRVCHCHLMKQIIWHLLFICACNIHCQEKL